MTVKDVNPLHSRYIELTARFKSSWTFHRFLDGLRKFFGQQGFEAYPFDFQSLYKQLREASVLLNSSAMASLRGELDRISKELDGVVVALDERDREVPPSLLRLFFQKVKTYNERILIEMVRFYQEVQRDRSWEPDRVDKTDFLISRLAENIAGPELNGDRSRLAKVLERLSENVSLGSVDPQKVANRLKLIQAVRAEMRDVDSFEELTQRDLVGHYRSLKHSLGNLFFEASILPRIVDTNASLSALIHGLARREEERIFTDYRRVSELEKGGRVGRDVLDAVTRLHLQVSAFRKQLKVGNLRIVDLAELREALTDVDQLLDSQVATEVRDDGGEGGYETGSRFRPFEVRELFTSTEAQQQISPALIELVDALSSADPEAAAEDLVSAAGLVPFRLEPREITAYRLLATGADCDERLEGFLLAAAALRRKINRDVDEMHGALNEAPGGGSPVPDKVAQTLLLADWYLRQFSHFLEVAMVAELPQGVREIQRCRMHLMRDYSGLWLEAHRLG